MATSKTVILKTSDNWKQQYDCTNRKYLYLPKYGRYHYNSNEESGLGDDRQSEMAAETGSTYISKTTRDSIEIPTANLGFTTMDSSRKASASDCNSERQPEVVIWPPKPEIFISLEL